MRCTSPPLTPPPHLPIFPLAEDSVTRELVAATLCNISVDEYARVMMIDMGVVDVLATLSGTTSGLIQVTSSSNEPKHQQSVNIRGNLFFCSDDYRLSLTCIFCHHPLPDSLSRHPYKSYHPFPPPSHTPSRDPPYFLSISFHALPYFLSILIVPL